MTNNNPAVESLPVDVVILTVDHEVRGTVYVSKSIKTSRQLTELLNDKQRRFLAITDAEIIDRKNPSSPRKYNFLQIHMDYILLVHPATQVLIRQNARAQEDVLRFRELRDKLNRTSDF